jgi:N-acetyl-gamma-glutamyl-phosphate reductase
MLGRVDGGGAVIIGNPGCYPTAVTLGLFPALREGVAARGVRIADGVSGLSGAGRELKRETHYSEAADSAAAYGVGGHRHTPEIVRNVRQIERGGRDVIFTPHLSPMNRGILATLYVPLAPVGKSAGRSAPKRGLLKSAGAQLPFPASPETAERAAAVRETYTAFYRDEPFVRVLPAGLAASTARVRGSNFCDISVHLDHSGSTLIVCSAIDNMVKGAAGQAIQNMNIIFGLAETAGLELTPLVF